MSGLGALNKLRVVLSEMIEGTPLSKKDISAAKSWLANEGAEFPHANPYDDYAVELPRLDVGSEVYRGGSPKLRLKQDGPIFSALDPRDALWYTSEFTNVPDVGALGKYGLTSKPRPAALRDVLGTMLDEDLQQFVPETPNMNVWDWLYKKPVRDRLREKGFDSAYGLDPLDRGEINTFIGFDPSQLQQIERKVLAFPRRGRSIKDTELRGKNFELDPEFIELGTNKKWRGGGLARMRGK